MMQHTWRELRAVCLYRDGYACQVCGSEATEADHIVPRSKGGRDALDNLRALCRSCNAAKGDRLEIDRSWTQDDLADVAGQMVIRANDIAADVKALHELRHAMEAVGATTVHEYALMGDAA